MTSRVEMGEITTVAPVARRTMGAITVRAASSKGPGNDIAVSVRVCAPSLPNGSASAPAATEVASTSRRDIRSLAISNLHVDDVGCRSRQKSGAKSRQVCHEDGARVNAAITLEEVLVKDNTVPQNRCY